MVTIPFRCRRKMEAKRHQMSIDKCVRRKYEIPNLLILLCGLCCLYMMRGRRKEEMCIGYCWLLYVFIFLPPLKVLRCQDNKENVYTAAVAGLKIYTAILRESFSFGCRLSWYLEYLYVMYSPCDYDE